jgi:hypothetical protein
LLTKKSKNLAFLTDTMFFRSGFAGWQMNKFVG